MVAPAALKPGKLHPFTGHDVPWLLRLRAAETPNRVFLVFAPFRPTESWTYRRFHEIAFLAGDRVIPFEDGHIRVDGRNKDMLRSRIDNKALRQRLVAPDAGASLAG
ncbi:MAG: hypothetical protein WDM91_22865 [Rhizomicrobium sp.]